MRMYRLCAGSRGCGDVERGPLNGRILLVNPLQSSSTFFLRKFPQLFCLQRRVCWTHKSRYVGLANSIRALSVYLSGRTASIMRGTVPLSGGSVQRRTGRGVPRPQGHGSAHTVPLGLTFFIAPGAAADKASWQKSYTPSTPTHRRTTPSARRSSPAMRLGWR